MRRTMLSIAVYFAVTVATAAQQQSRRDIGPKAPWIGSRPPADAAKSLKAATTRARSWLRSVGRPRSSRKRLRP